MALVLAVLMGGSAFAEERGVSLGARCFEAALQARADGSLNVGGGGTGDVGEVLVPRVPAGSTSGASSADAPLSGGGGGGSSLGGGGGGGGGELLLVAAVVVVAALPIVLYAVDGDANEETLTRYECPSLRLGLTGGAMAGAADANVFVPLSGFSFEYTQGFFGVGGSYEGTWDGLQTWGSMEAHALLRPKPKKHVELGLSVGFRRVVFGGAERNGLEVGLPHRYALARIDGRPLGLELTPALFVGNRGLDARLEGDLIFPVGPVTLRTGGRVFSFDHHIRGGAQLGMSFGF